MNLRVFDCHSTVGPRGAVVIDDVQLANEGHCLVGLVDALRINAFAVPLRDRVRYRVLQHELRLLSSYLTDARMGRFALRHDDFRSSASHIRRFITESVGMGMLTAATQEVYRWSGNEHGIANFDTLPTNLAEEYGGPGVRPDLLFKFTGKHGDWMLAGEARGRFSRRTKSSHPASDQRQRMEQLLQWSIKHNDHPVSMAWTHTKGREIDVDYFRIYPPTPDLYATAERIGSESMRTNTRDGAGSGDPWNVEGRLDSAQARERVVERARHIEDQLYASAFDESSSEQELFSRPVRGGWTRADLLGPSNTQLFLGVLSEAPEGAALEQISHRQRRDSTMREIEPIQIAILDRLIVGIAYEHAQPPTWREIAVLLE